MWLFRKILAGLVKDKPGSDEPGFVYFMGLFLLGGIHLESIDS